MNPSATFPDALSSERLLLRRCRAEDADYLQALVSENRQHLIQSFPEMARGLSTPAEMTEFLEDKAMQWAAGKIFCYCIWRTDSSALIGQIQVKNIVWNVPSAELSYFIATTALRRGYASEAVRCLQHLLFERLGFNRLFVRIVAENAASLALAEALGFRSEGLHRQAFRCGLGLLHDVHHLAALKSDPRRAF
jgi:RimJ/RimL family protein N-acetyltransferase